MDWLNSDGRKLLFAVGIIFIVVPCLVVILAVGYECTKMCLKKFSRYLHRVKNSNSKTAVPRSSHVGQLQPNRTLNRALSYPPPYQNDLNNEISEISVNRIE